MNFIVIAFGSNLGNKIENINKAIDLIPYKSKVTSFLYRNPPQYFTEQPEFYNGVFSCCTDEKPNDVLSTLKDIEMNIGRKETFRNGPRVIDLDLIFYGDQIIESDKLIVPHPRLHERDFVLTPLMDICPEFIHPILKKSVKELFKELKENTLIKCIQIDKKEIIWKSRTLVMGIINVTPDSFYDEGFKGDLDSLENKALEMIKEGVDIIDIGGQSTKPDAKLVMEEDELERVLPLIKRIRAKSDILISIDTFYSSVAKEAIKEGVNIINDVTGGRFDPNIIKISSELNIPIILMHSRGDSQTMMNLKQYKNVVEDSRNELKIQINKALEIGVRRWNIILDPGIGFAKDMDLNIEIIKNIEKWKGDFPCLIGTSRKSFIGKIIDKEPKDRLYGSLATIVLSSMNGANIVRVHDVKETIDCVKVTNKIYPLK